MAPFVEPGAAPESLPVELPLTSAGPPAGSPGGPQTQTVSALAHRRRHQNVTLHQNSRGQRRGPWSEMEDRLLMAQIDAVGLNDWTTVADAVGSRDAKQCRERYHQNLRPDLNHEPLTPEECDTILTLVERVGKKWAEIARRLNGRCDNQVKNWWNSQNNHRRRDERKRHRDQEQRTDTRARAPFERQPHRELPRYSTRAVDYTPHYPDHRSRDSPLYSSPATTHWHCAYQASTQSQAHDGALRGYQPTSQRGGPPPSVVQTQHGLAPQHGAANPEASPYQYPLGRQQDRAHERSQVLPPIQASEYHEPRHHQGTYQALPSPVTPTTSPRERSCYALSPSQQHRSAEQGQTTPRFDQPPFYTEPPTSSTYYPRIALPTAPTSPHDQSNVFRDTLEHRPRQEGGNFGLLRDAKGRDARLSINHLMD